MSQAYVGSMEARPTSILYIETDIPPQMTCADYRRRRSAARRRPLRARLFRRSRAR
jgi:hypothetical protein